MGTNYDAIVLGTGGVGSAAMYHLARRGASVLGIDRFDVPHDRGSSHGGTRIIRQAYYEHPDYVPLLLRAYELWADLEQACGERLYHEVGLLQVGPADGQIVAGVLASARLHGLSVEQLSPREVHARWTGLAADERLAAVFERRAGYLRVESCVAAHLAQARRAGAEFRGSTPVLGWRSEGAGVALDIEGQTFRASRLIITAGAWAADLLSDLGIGFEVLRKSLFWYQGDAREYRAGEGCPCFLYETSDGNFYGFPNVENAGVKVAEHSGGQVVDDPLVVDREIDPDERRRVEQFTAANLPGLGRQLERHAVCLYTMSPDKHFVVDRHPRFPQVLFAAGLSGHGFKFTSVLGQALAELALDGSTELPISFLDASRFATRRV